MALLTLCSNNTFSGLTVVVANFRFKPVFQSLAGGGENFDLSAIGAMTVKNFECRRRAGQEGEVVKMAVLYIFLRLSSIPEGASFP